MPNILHITPPNLHTILTQSLSYLDEKTFQNNTTITTNMAQHVLNAIEAATLRLWNNKGVEKAETAWLNSPRTETIQWQRLLASQHLSSNMPNIATVATKLDIPFVQILINNPLKREVFGIEHIVGATIFGDNSFVIHVDGRLSTPKYWGQPVLHLEETSIDDLHQALQTGQAILLTKHAINLGDPIPTYDRMWNLDYHKQDDESDGPHTLTSELIQIWYDHDDPPFEPEDEWNNLSETPVMDQLFELFLSLAGPKSIVSFSVESSSYGNTPGIHKDTLEYEHFPGELFARIAEATIDFSCVTGGTWEYNDGAMQRKSGYSFNGSVAYTTYGPQEWKNSSAHKRLKLRAQLLDMARHDPRLANLRKDIEAHFHSDPKDTTP